jgi:class 3 adenylate cyclase/tetratricopeptide (TPR) repeat protein
MSCVTCGAGTADGDRFCPRCGTPLHPLREPEADRETRKKVSVLFIDLVGSTELGERLDPEPLRQVLDRYFAACIAVITEHGGNVEKFIGDAVMAVFGITQVHEDDAIRAVRAAAGALAALEELNAELTASHQLSLQARCGVYSGDVLAVSLPGGDFRVVGDAVNTAARLQSAAQPGEIMIGADTAAMVRSQVGIEPVPPLRLKGKAQPVPAWRVIQPVKDEADGGSRLTPFIGRADELAELRRAFVRVSARGESCLLTVLGPPGIGKSRLVREFLATVPAGQASVLSARCRAYGRGLSYAPLAELLRSAPGGWDAVRRTLAAEPGPGQRAASTLDTLLEPAAADPGAAPASVPAAEGGVEEIAWAVRHLIESLSRTCPVILVWEDLHWAEPTLLDLIDDIATWLPDTPVLVLAVARGELLETRPSWGGGTPHAAVLEVAPLDSEETAALVAELYAGAEVVAHADDDGPARVAAQCDGNPLFAELMLDVFAEIAPGNHVPPTIGALLGARLDQLPAQERQVLEMAAVIGREFTGAEVRMLAGPGQGSAEPAGRGPADLALARLVRRRILRRAGTDAFRFDQSLMRDAAYTFTPKSRRDQWHLRLSEFLSAPDAQALDGRAAGAPSPEAVLAFAYHAEAACLLRRELRPGDRDLPALASTAADALIAEGMRALGRKDLPGALALLERGRGLLPDGDSRHSTLALYISDAAIAVGDEDRALAALAAAEAAGPGDHRTMVTCAAQRQITALRLGLAAPDRVAARTQPVLDALTSEPDDDLGWCRYHQLEAYLDLAAERAAAADEALHRALGRARTLGNSYEEERLLCAICEVAQWAPVPVPAGLALGAELTIRFAANRALQVPILVTRARLSAMAGDIGVARQLLATARSYADDLHLDLADAAVLAASGFAESLAGQHARAAADYRQALAILGAAPGRASGPEVAAEVARELLADGDDAAAEIVLDRVETADAPLQAGVRIAVTSIRALIASVRGDHEPALRYAAAAAALAASTDDLFLAGEALFSVARVQQAASLPEEAAASASSALDRFAAKGAALPAAQVRGWLDARPGPAAHPGRPVPPGLAVPDGPAVPPGPEPGPRGGAAT